MARNAARHFAGRLQARMPPMNQGLLFTDDDAETAALPLISQTDGDGSARDDFDSCLSEFRTNHCTLDGEPARIVGTPRTAPYATIEPVDLDVEPMRCCWDVVDMAIQHGGAFTRRDDDTGQSLLGS
jgi:hypothetical protein